jgi:hypothetical protein
MRNLRRLWLPSRSYAAALVVCRAPRIFGAGCPQSVATHRPSERSGGSASWRSRRDPPLPDGVVEEFQAAGRRVALHRRRHTLHCFGDVVRFDAEVALSCRSPVLLLIMLGKGRVSGRRDFVEPPLRLGVAAWDRPRRNCDPAPRQQGGSDAVGDEVRCTGITDNRADGDIARPPEMLGSATVGDRWGGR